MLLKQQILTEPRIYLWIDNWKRKIYQSKDNILSGSVNVHYFVFGTIKELKVEIHISKLQFKLTEGMFFVLNVSYYNGVIHQTLPV